MNNIIPEVIHLDCPKCGKEVDASFDKCPYCGALIDENFDYIKKKPRYLLIFMVILLILLVPGITAMLIFF